jgi:hypothetical protein
MRRGVLLPQVFAVFLTLLLFAACATANGTVNTSLPPGKGPAPTIILSNTAPSNIDLAMAVGIVPSFPNTGAHFQIAPIFYYQKTDIIQFKQGETFECGGNAIPMDSHSGYASATIPVPGTVIPCTYTSPQGQASFSFTVPERATIISPLSGATVTRSPQTPLTLGLTPACDDVGIKTGYEASPGTWEAGSATAPDGCAKQQTIDTTSFPAGPGVLGVQEYVKVNSITNNAGFHSLTLSISTETDIPVKWK